MSVHGVTEALAPLAQQHRTLALLDVLLDALLDAFLDRRLTPGLDDVLGSA